MHGYYETATMFLFLDVTNNIRIIQVRVIC